MYGYGIHLSLFKRMKTFMKGKSKSENQLTHHNTIHKHLKHIATIYAAILYNNCKFFSNCIVLAYFML